MAKIKMRKTVGRLGFLDEKPTVYKLRQLTYPMVKPKDLVKYISNSANVPKSTVEAAIAAIVEAIVYYAIRGCRVSFEGFGGFYVGIQCKCAQTLKEANADTIRGCRLLYAPNIDLRESLADAGTEIINSGVFAANDGTEAPIANP